MEPTAFYESCAIYSIPRSKSLALSQTINHVLTSISIDKNYKN